ncbi:MAG TPA: hypothetical protein VLA39_05140 [Marinobacterium sp.]|nr:hypothetical protein [Marinobacterium sp.]
MAQDNFDGDKSGWGWIAINLVALAWITMPVSIALVKVVQW